MPASRQILVTSALPYANGPIHLGHLVEYIQTDIWVRFQKQRGHTCYYVCADDTHGTPIMLKAQQENLTPETLIERMREEHLADFKAFHIRFDHYHSTHSPENQTLAASIYRSLQAKGHIQSRTITQAYDPVKEMFLPDRFIKGECPHCGARDQYGDNCEVCSRTYAPTELKNPVSAISGAKPIERESEHYFFKLSDFGAMLKNWIHAGHLQAEVANKLQEWLDAGLQDWDISRDAPYFGFEIPDAPGKYFYVWLDAPIGYMASFRYLCQRDNIDFDSFWGSESTAELYHFIGKDIIYFHGLFWPAMLTGADFRTPSAIFAHGFLTVNGTKMSKSRGTFIKARTYFDHLNPEYLRYYFAAKLSGHMEDIDLNFDDFVQRVNSDLVGKVVNIASRCSGFIHKYCAGRLAARCSDRELFQSFVDANRLIAELYENREYAKAMREIMGLADRANQYIDEQKPWVIAKQQGACAELQAVCSLGLNLFRLIIAYLKPTLPTLCEEAERFLNIPSQPWPEQATPLLDHRINVFQALMQRIDGDKIEAMIKASKELPATPPPAATPSHTPTALITIDDFKKIDLRVAKIVAAEYVEGADKLLKLTVAIGSQNRTVLAGIKAAYEPEALIGRLTVVVANIAPRKTRYGVSEAMLLAAGADDDQGLWLLHPDAGAQAGMAVK